jgi:two-component system CheB/CheR fusion protein
MVKRVATSRRVKRASAASPASVRPLRVGGPATPSTEVPGEAAFSVVGIGASAGGLDAFKKLFGAMPVDTGMAFVLIPHLDPTHESLMVELLAKQTAMPVTEARDGMAVQRNHVYVIPPNADLALTGRVLRVVPPPPCRGSQTAIDFFLRSLAADQGARAVGIILSGTGSHGTLGVGHIKTAGGLVIAQTPESAEHGQMPRSAIATGLVDHILPPEQIPPLLVRHVARLSAPAVDPAPEDISQLLTLLRTQAKRDFRGYRTSMLLRRVKRRMALGRVEGVADYVEYLRAHPDEVESLGKDLSISVTAFFREPDAFQVLEREVIPELVARSSQADGGEHPVRVWVPGCATGEEAYTLAMLFLEHFASTRQPPRLQIFATDIDDEALEVARTGVYPESVAAQVSGDRLQHFFLRAGAHHYQVSKALRELITFAPQNLMSDAPFSKLDLIACRNVLIYLEPAVQAKVLALFHYALVEGGYLLLGPAESIGAATDQFEPISKKWRVYRRTSAAGRGLADIPILPASARSGHVAHRDERSRPPAVGELLHRALLADFAPAAVLVNRRYQILSVEGPVVDYLEFPPGELTRDLLAMARPGLRAAIRGACERAVQTHRAVSDATARVRRDRTYASCTITARQAGGARDGEGLLLVTFQDRSRRPAQAAKKPAHGVARPRGGGSTLVRQLEHELQATRDDLQGTIDELQIANEDLKGSHEEVMSMNEELQSTNEEMETSKEELQSLNEELSTVNSQLQDKVHELDSANNDMVNLLASTDIATVFLDGDLRIKRFTPPTTRLLNLLPTDLGRPFRDIAPRVADPALFDDCRRVIEKLAPLELVVRADDTAAYLRRVLPYRTADHRIDGVVVTWVDITRRLEAEAESRRLTAVLRDSSDAVALLDLEGRITGWNRGAERLYGYTEAEALAKRLRDLAPDTQWPVLDDLVRRISRGDVASESAETLRTTKDGRTRDVSLTMTLLRDAAGRPDALVVTERDVTEIKEGLAARETAQLYRQVIEDLPAGAVLRKDGQIALNQAAEAITGYARNELTTVDAWCAALHGDRALELRPHYEPSRAEQRAAQPVSLAIRHKNGRARHVEISVLRLDNAHDLWMLLDRTETDQSAQALRRSEDYLRSIVATAADAIITIDEHGAIDTFNPAAERMFGYTALEAVGQNVRLLMPPPYRDEHDGYLARYKKTGEARIIGIGREVVGLRKDGATFPLDLAVSEIDHRRRFTGILRDLSDRRELEWRLAESQLGERRHMARELHDDVGGHFTGIGLLAQTLESELERLQSPAVPRAQQLVRSIGDAHQRLRAVIRGLMPVDAIPEGLMAALENLARQCEAASGIRCVFECEPPVHVSDPGTALHLFRIAQEGVNNAVRHAAATQIRIVLEQDGPRLRIVVADNGRGLGEIPAGHAGVGLASMRQRARLLGGECTLQSEEGRGTTVRCWVPTPALAARGRVSSPPQQE